MARKIWAGLDVGVETTSVCVIDDDGKVLHEGKCPTKVRDIHRQLVFIKRRRFARVGIETGMGTILARGLRNLGYSVDIYEARQLSKFLRARRNKTDAGDANGIAQAGRVGASIVSKVYLKAFDCQSLGSRLAIRRHIISSRVRCVNVLCRQIEHFGGRIEKTGKLYDLRRKFDQQIKELFGRTSNPVIEDLRRLVTVCENFGAMEKEIDDELKRIADRSEVCSRFMRIPGVGPICALTFCAAVGEPNRFKSGSAIGSYLGLTPRLRQSGMMFRMGRISKMGNRAARSLLVQASVHFMRWAPADLELRAWATEVEKRRGRGRSRVALARKLGTIMLAMWKNEEDFQPTLVSTMT